jgi:hypothetical protein
MRESVYATLTNPEGLYFSLTELYNIPTRKLAYEIAKRTNLTEDSTYVYLCNRMWKLPSNNFYTTDYRETTDYKVLEILQLLYKQEAISQGRKNWKDYK